MSTLRRPDLSDGLPTLFTDRDLGRITFPEGLRAAGLSLEAYDRMAVAIARGGHGWTPLANIPAGQGPRHPVT